MNSFFSPFSFFLVLFICLFNSLYSVEAQVIDKDHIISLIESGKDDKAIKNLEHFLGPDVEISQEDSAFAFQYLGMIHGQKENLTKAKTYFTKLFFINPRATIHNTDASHSIIEAFSKTKNEFKKEHGGDILRPKVIVMNSLGEHMEEKYRQSISRQFIEELQGLWLFDAMNWNDIKQQLESQKLVQSECENEACFIKLAKNLDGDKLVLIYFDKVGGVNTLLIKYMDVISGAVNSTIKRKTLGNMDSLVLHGLQKLAIQLEKDNAAWLKFSLEPAHAYLELNNSVTSGEKRIPVMPGKHKVCASSDGYEELCKTIEVKPKDGLTHRLKLTPIMSGQAEKPRTSKITSENQPQRNMAKTFNTELWILGGLGIIALGLIILFNR